MDESALKRSILDIIAGFEDGKHLPDEGHEDISKGPPNTLAPGIAKQSTSAYDIHTWNDPGQNNDRNSAKETTKTFSSKTKNGHSGKVHLDSNNSKEKPNNRHFDLPFRHPKVRSLSNRMSTSAFGSLPRRRANTTGSKPPPPSRSRSETFIHVPQASFDDDVQYSDEGSLYEQNEIVGESNTSRFPWQRDIGVQCQKKYKNAEVQVNIMTRCPQCGSHRQSGNTLVNGSNHGMLGNNSTSALHHTSRASTTKPPELMLNGLPDTEADADYDIISKSRTRERPLSDPGIDQFDNIPWINTNVNSEAEEFINMKVKKEKLRLNLPTEYADSKSFPLSPCPSPHKQVRRSPPKVKPHVVISAYDSDSNENLAGCNGGDVLPGALSERLESLSTSFLLADADEPSSSSLNVLGSDTSSSSLRVPSPELLQTRATYSKEKMVNSGSEVTDEEEDPPCIPQSHRIQQRRGAVISQLPQSSSDVIVNADAEDSSPGSQQEGQSRRTSAGSRAGGSRSPSLQTPLLGDSLFPSGLITNEHRLSIMSDASTTLHAVAAGHLQDAIEASVTSGFNGTGNSIGGTPDATDTKKSMTVTARFLKKFGKESDRSMIKDITAVFTNFKIRDQDELEFAAFKDKHWRELVTSPTHEGGLDSTTSMHSPSELKRRDKVWELFRAECVYLIEHILVLKNVFQEPLRALQCEGFLMFAEPSKLFANIDEIYQVSTTFCRDVIRLLLGKSKTEFGQTEAVIDAFKSFDSRLCPAYQRYCMNYSGALHYLEMLKKRDDFSEFLKLCEMDRRCKRLQLNDLLVAPIQHVTKYPLLLKDIRERTEDEQERALLTTTVETVANALNDLDGKVKWLSNFERLRELQQLIQWPSLEDSESRAALPEFLRDTVAKLSKNNLLASTKRTLLHEGPLNIFDGGKPTEMYVFLFDDMVLLTKQRKAPHKKKSIPSENAVAPPATPVSRRKDAVVYIVHKPPLPLDRLDIMELDQKRATANGLKNAFALIQMNRYQQVTGAYTLMAQEDSTKTTWLSHVKSAKDNWIQMLRDERDNFQPSHGQRDRKHTL